MVKKSVKLAKTGLLWYTTKTMKKVVGLLNSANDFLQGKKTYIIAALMTLIGLVQFLTGDMSLVEFLNSPDVVLFLNGLGLATMRAALAKVA